MKKWVIPLIIELDTEMTNNVVNREGSDNWGEEGTHPETGENVDLGSCC